MFGFIIKLFKLQNNKLRLDIRIRQNYKMRQVTPIKGNLM